MPDGGQQTGPACRFLANIRDLGGIACEGGATRYHRFLRSASPSSATASDFDALHDWGVRHVVDLRGQAESPQASRFAHLPWIRWTNISLFDVDVTARLETGQACGDNYLVNSYLSMLSSPRPIREVFEFFAEVPTGECALFHCAAGMDRTGMISMLLLALAGASRHDIIFDYCLSFAQPSTVEAALTATAPEPEREPKRRRWGKRKAANVTARLLNVRLEAISSVYDRLLERFGSAEAYLEACGISEHVRDAVVAHLTEE
jgi:protein-tyrosine phosphatase